MQKNKGGTIKNGNRKSRTCFRYGRLGHISKKCLLKDDNRSGGKRDTEIMIVPSALVIGSNRQQSPKPMLIRLVHTQVE